MAAMTLEDEVRFITDHFCGMKTALCEREGGPSDLLPMLHFKYRHLNAYCGMVLPPEETVEALPAAWSKVLEDGIPEFMMIMVEGYAGTKTEEYERGAMERDFRENPSSSVREVITIQAVDIKTGNQITSVVPYGYDDRGMPEFDDPKIAPCVGEALEFNIPAMFRQFRDLAVNLLDEAA